MRNFFKINKMRLYHQLKKRRWTKQDKYLSPWGFFCLATMKKKFENALYFARRRRLVIMEAPLRSIPDVSRCICRTEWLHSFSSQKHIRPLPPPSDIQTWSTMNKLISKSSVQPRRTFIPAEKILVLFLLDCLRI